MELKYKKTLWLCRELHPLLLESYLEPMSGDYGMPVRACEGDCDGCKARHDVVIEESKPNERTML